MPRYSNFALAPALLLALSAQSAPRLGYDAQVFDAEADARCRHLDPARCIQLAPSGRAESDLSATSSSGALLSADAAPSLPYRIAELLAADEMLGEAVSQQAPRIAAPRWPTAEPSEGARSSTR